MSGDIAVAGEARNECLHIYYPCFFEVIAEFDYLQGLLSWTT